jgi:putative hydrolase of the HAD superfamily
LTAAVVFDLFHTLVDPEERRPRTFDRIAEAARVLGVDPDRLRIHWDDSVYEAATTPGRTAAVLARICDPTPGEAILGAVDDAMGRYQDLAIEHPLPGVIGTLDSLHGAGIRLGLLSNALERDVRAWPGSALARRFDAAVFSCFAGAMKPEAAAYRAVLDELGVPAGRAWFVGDGNAGELTGARAAGFGRVVVVTGPALRSGLRTPGEMTEIAADADLEIGDVSRLPDLLGLSGPRSGW